MGTDSTKHRKKELSNFEKEVVKNAKIKGLEKFSKNFKILYAPTICKMEIYPLEGVSLAEIKKHSAEISAAVGSEQTRVFIEADHVSAEYPRTFPEEEDFWESLECQAAIDCTGLPLALGFDYSGNVIEDLTRCPHILVAGASGQGKSNCLRSMIDSILYFNRPDRVKFALIDASGWEFSTYSALNKDYLFNGGPATTEEQALQMLRDLTDEMESRYKALAKSHCQDIGEYPMPYIAVFIDEFADFLLGGNAKEFNKNILAITRKGRRVGIHCVMATQRVCTDTISGAIKASFPYRIAFRVTNRIESMAILDCVGAEKLCGKGDMLVMKGFELQRVQGGLESLKNSESLVIYSNERLSTDNNG